ncbi:hypothetical protein PR002_g25912 [Phytophthora rubi]|uniref:Uncharacterized protein n=1 Tax=Phytophthora rubi TaxID=129364 RepID=A0A6A3HZC3_9STRA|nr:hypothetical protein PR002_g25912 [Phytophthora rubi]
MSSSVLILVVGNHPRGSGDVRDSSPGPSRAEMQGLGGGNGALTSWYWKRYSGGSVSVRHDSSHVLLAESYCIY